MGDIYKICSSKGLPKGYKMDEDILSHPDKFFVAGIITSPGFQRAKFIVTKLYRCFPHEFESPEIRPMLNVDWEEFITKLKRKYGNGIWALKKPVTVFLNNVLIGQDEDLLKHICKKYHITLDKDWYDLGRCHLVDYLREIMAKFRQLIYITVSIRHRVIGTMLFQLYNDLVPETCENFVSKCLSEITGYNGKSIHRVVKNGWIQCGGWSLPEIKMACENYIVPHNRRGVLSMCNVGPHRKNSTQFFITLAPAPWMNYRYVAFGQLLQGEEILKQLEAVPTYYESPRQRIDIVQCGELTFEITPDYLAVDDVQSFMNICPTTLLDSLIGPRGLDMYPTSGSIFSFTKFKRGDYALRTDLKPYYWPFMDVSDYLAAYLYYPEAPPKDMYDIDAIVSENFRRELEAYQRRIPCPSLPSSSDITI